MKKLIIFLIYFEYFDIILIILITQKNMEDAYGCSSDLFRDYEIAEPNF